jgi:hypothetical protein
MVGPCVHVLYWWSSSVISGHDTARDGAEGDKSLVSYAFMLAFAVEVAVNTPFGRVGQSLH